MLEEEAETQLMVGSAMMLLERNLIAVRWRMFKPYAPERSAYIA
tara:strand:- start:86 stop:217 length:132 start_codon:yes stop_codon:yes gene_type:complete